MSGEAQMGRWRNRKKGDGTPPSPNANSGQPNSSSKKVKAKSGGPQLDTSDLVLWRSPWLVIKYSTLEIGHYLLDWFRWLSVHKLTLLFVCVLVGLFTAAHNYPGPHQVHLQPLEKLLLWCGWWVGLGILSSVGLGTGLHTFLLYLGPHIAAVTLAAYECQSTDFPEPPYPDDIICPETQTAAAVTIWTILSKVRLEAFCWGAGTAIGELPPYFMARAARLHGSEPGEEEQEFLELQEKLKNPEKMTTVEKWKYRVQWAVQKVGFMGILLCASIPNPLFDLAGITCGHFLVPFWTFFGATLIGKAIIKMHIQKLFVIFAFNEDLIEHAISLIHTIPGVGLKMEAPIRALLATQKDKLHKKGGAGDASGGNILSAIFEKFVMAMVVYFVVSIVHSLAQSYRKRMQDKKKH
jgi:membrane protein YqaA with SNARE-associated domain